MSDMDQDFSDSTPQPNIGRDEIQGMWRQREFFRNMQVAKGIDGDADAAAQSQQLETVTGVPASLIAENHEEFVAQQKKTAAQHIVAANPDLDAYVMSHPLASTISNDDWAALDKFTRESSGGFFKSIAKATESPLVPLADEAIKGGVSGVIEGLQNGIPVNDATRRAMDPNQNVLGTLGASASSLLFGTMDIAQRLMSAMGGGIEGAAVGAGSQLGVGESESRRVAETFMNLGMAESGMHMHPTEVKPQTALDVARPYLEGGKEPPSGLHLEIDKHKADINSELLDKIDKDLSNAASSTTRERSPELFQKLAERMYGDSTIGLHADAALALYGDKVPSADDGLLGWMPDMQAQLDAARETGTDVSIPLKDYLSKIDPAIAKTLHDDLRVWPGGVTAREADALPTEPRQIIDEALPNVRAGAGLEPKFSMGDRKLTLSLFDKTADEDAAGKPMEMHDFDINDENGQNVGRMRLVPGADGKTLYVDYIGGKAGLWANSFGPSLVRDIKRQLKAAYPDYEYLTGHRVTGARVGTAAMGEETPMPLPRVRLSAESDATETYSAAEHKKLLDVLQNGWEQSSEGSQMLVNRQAPGFYTQHQLAMGQAAADEIAKLTGGRAEPQGVAAIHMQGQSASQKIRGAYAPQYDSAPKIFYDLLGNDPVGISRHESVHMLRDYKLFTPEEWLTLHNAAHAEGWLDRYGINSRYTNLGINAKTEEAVAEAFRDWAAQAEDIRPKTGVGAVFQKMWDFLDRIRKGMGKYLGREPTWEEVFQKTATGEVGAREPGVPGREGQFRFSSDTSRETLYHGTSKDKGFDKFRDTRNGTWFTTDPKSASEYAEENDSRGAKFVGGGKIQEVNTASRVVAMYHDFQKTLTIDSWPDRINVENYKAAQGKWFDELRAEGYDSVRFKGKDGHDIVVALDNSKLTPKYAPNPVKGGPKFSIEDQRKAIIEGIDNLQAASIGMDTARFQRIKDAIRKRAEEDLKKAQANAEKEQVKRQTKEWKANRSDMAKEVAKEIRNRPDVAADLFFGQGELYGKKIQQRFTLAEDKLSEAQRATLPDHYVSKNGLDPDQVAGLFGYSSGDEMVSKIGAIEALKNVGETRMRSEDFIRKTVAAETDRRMEQRYGNLAENILDMAHDQALSDSAVNVQYEEYRAVAESQGSVVFDKAVVQQAARNILQKMPIGKVSSFRIMQDMGRDSRNAEKAMIDGNWAEAAVHMERQTKNMMMAAEAKALEKRIVDFDKTAKRWAKRDQPSVPTEYANWVHAVLKQVGKPVKMSDMDLARQIEGEGTKSLEEFVQNKAQDLSALDVWEQLFDRSWGKVYKDLTAEEFDQVKDSIDTLIKTGRREKKVIAQGEEYDLDVVVRDLIEAVKKLPFTDVEKQKTESIVARIPKGYMARALQVENVFGRWDKFDAWGVWTQKVFRDLKDGDNQADAWRKEYSKRLGEAGDKEDLNKAVDNKLFHAPEIYGGDLIPMNRGSLRAVMLNLGNESSIAKISKGWRVAPEAIQAFVKANAKKEDWEFVQKIWDIFKELKDKSDTMYRSMGRIASKTIDAQPFENEHGKFSGGYYPVIFHKDYTKIPALESANGLMQAGYESVYPPAGYKIGRKNFFAPLAMDIDSLPNRLNQVIHDAAMRPSVENFGKIIFDSRIKAAIKTHAGNHVYDMMTDYIKGVANKANTGVAAWKDGSTLSNFMRQNMMAGLVGFNPGTVLKHGFTAGGLSVKEVGLPAFFDAVRSLHSVNDATGESNYQFAMRESLELQRRDRNYGETLFGATGELSPVKDVRLGGVNAGPAVGKFMDYRQRLMEIASKPLAFSDKLSSVPTWLAAYDEASEKGMNHGDAVFAGDRAVRRAHGSTAITSRPVIMNELNPWLTTFYNFFNDVFNRQVETLWKAGEAVDLAKSGQKMAALKMAGTVGAGIFAYSIWPAVVEAWVSPQPSDPNESWAKRAAKGMAFTEGSTLPVVRDFTNLLLEGKNPDVGLWSTLYRHSTDLIRDTQDKKTGPAHAQKMIRDSAEIMAVFAGVPEELGKLGSAAYGLHAGTEHPHGPWGWGVLGRYGTLKGHSQTGGQYMSGQYDRSR